MAKIVSGYIMPHDPSLFVNPQKKERDHLLGAYTLIREKVEALGATKAIIFGADHYILFSPRCLPQFLIATGELHGPIERLPGVANSPIASDSAFARSLVDYAHGNGFDVAVARDLGVDHAIGVPAQLALPTDGSVKTVPVYMASGVEPYVRLQRAYKFGQMVREAVAAMPTDDRIVLMGSGGISHWVGTGEMGRINPEFDKKVLDAIESGDPAPLLAMTDQEIMREGGNGGMEIRHFLAVMGALPGGSGEVLAYEGWSGGVTGLGFAEILPSA